MDIIKELFDFTEEELKNGITTNSLDLSKEEDLKEFKNTIEELKSNNLFKVFISLFSGVDDIDKVLDNINKIADNVHEKTKEEKKPSTPPRASEKLTADEGLQLHKLVQEYFDTMIYPYINKDDEKTKKTVNDAYVGLFEFGAWILKK